MRLPVRGGFYETNISEVKFVANLIYLLHRLNGKFSLFVQRAASDSEPKITAIFSMAYVTKIYFSLYDSVLLSSTLEALTPDGSSRHGIT
jgi:hypothetical protein